MDTQTIQQTVLNPPPRSTGSPGAEAIKVKRQDYQQDSSSADTKSVQPEELLNNIKALTEDGLYSVRFEMNAETHELIISLVDYKSGEVIRQIPPEEVVHLQEHMKDLRGNIVDTES